MRNVATTLAGCLILALLWPAPAVAQVGGNKINYDRFEWKVYHSPHFDIHYYPEEEEFLEQMVSFAESAYLKLSEDLDHQISERIPLIYYKTHPEFAQTNIALQEIPEAVGAFAEPFQNRIVLPIDEPPDKLYALVLHELVHIFEYDILFAGNIGRAIRSNPPLWIMEGLASYLAGDEDSFDQMVIRDAVVNSIVPRIEQLNQLSFLTYRFGNAVFTFIESRWGMEGIRNFLFEYRKVLLTGNIPKALKEAYGLDVEDFNREFRQYLRKRYLPTLLEKEEPAAYGREIGFKRPGVFTFGPSVSPGGELIAVLANRKLELDLWIVSGSDGEPIRNLTRGFTNDYLYLTAEVFKGKRDVSWSPAGDQVAAFARKENRRLLILWDARTGRRLKMIKMPGIALQESPAFSPDGRRIAFAGNVGGIYDIFSYDLETGDITNHTDDDAVDSNPMWSADGSTLLYNRRINAFEKVFTVSATDPTRKTQLTFGESSDIMPAYSRDGSRIYYSSDRANGIFNLYSLDLAGGSERQLTDVITGAFAPVELDTLGDKNVVVFTSYFQGRYRLFRMEVGPPVEEIAGADRDLTPVELRPFRPPLRLTLDENEKKPYKRRYQVESPSLELGVTDDGTVFGNSFLSLTDLLGDRRWIIGLASVSSFSRIDIYHLALARRTDWIYHAYQYEDFFFFPVAQTPSVVVVDRIEQRRSGISAGIQYPFNRYYGLSASLGVSDSSVPVFETIPDPMDQQQSITRLVERDFQSADAGLFFTGDTVRWQQFGPYHGQRFQIGALYSPEIGGDGGTIAEYRMDYRKYIHMSRRSLLAYRMFGVVSNASETEFRRFYTAGGLNTLRGYGFRDFVGDRVFFQNFEVRFPLVDRLQLPFGSFTSIRGLLFLDVGGAYFEGGEWFDQETGLFVFKNPNPAPGDPEFTDAFGTPREAWDFWDSKENRLNNGVASFGAGINIRLGFLELNWVFSRRTDFSQTDNDWRSSFYIGNKF